MRITIAAAILAATAVVAPGLTAGAAGGTEDGKAATTAAAIPLVTDIPYLFNPFDSWVVTPRACELKALGLDLPYLFNPFDGRSHAPGVRCHH